MKFVYVLTSSENDIYYEQFYLSLVSLRIYNPDVTVIALIDEKTKQGLTGKRSGYEMLVSETVVVSVPSEFSQKEASRWIKTSVHHYVSGDFLYIDCDTVITGKLEYSFHASVLVGAVPDSHIELEKHHYRKEFISQNENLGFGGNINLVKYYYNGGLIFCRDDEKSLSFYEKWHSLWLECCKKGDSQDMPSLNRADYEHGNIITEINGEWNCQISHNGMPFLNGAKIIHYYATSLISLTHPYKLASAGVFASIKETGEISSETVAMLQNPLTAFETNTRLISDIEALDVLNCSLFYKLLWLRRRHISLYNMVNGLSAGLTLFVKKVLKMKK